jgi:hypothetical protein
MSETTIRHEGAFTVVRSALGQVAEYDVYEAAVTGAHKTPVDIYRGGGTKSEALKIFRKLSGKS